MALVYLKHIIVLSIFMVLLAPTASTKGVEPIASYSPSSDNPSTKVTRTDRYLLAHLGNFRPATIANGDITEEENAEARLKDRVIESEIPSHPASSSIASFFEEYFGPSSLANNDITPIDTMAGNNPFSTSMLFETLSILTTLTTYPNNNLINVDLSRILGLGNTKISAGLVGQLPSGIQIPMGRFEENALNPIGYFLAFTIRF